MSAAVKTRYEPPPNGFRTFLIVWVTQSISVFGSALTFFAATIWLTQGLYPRSDQKPELAAAISLTSLAFALPTVFGAPIAGAWADRHDRKRTMMLTDFANGLVSVTIAGLLFTGSMQLWTLVALVALSATCGAFHGSAFDTSYAMLVPEAQLPRANGMMQTIWSLSGILSPAIAAALIALPAVARQGLVPTPVANVLAPFHDGTPVAVGVDAITFFLASATLLFLFIPSPKRTDLGAEPGQKKKSFWSDIKEGALFIWHRRPLLWLLGTFTVANFVASPLGVFTPLIVKFNLAADWGARGMTFETALALLSSLGGFGGLAGGIFISTWGGLKRKKVYGIVIPMLLSAVGMVVYGFSGVIYVTAIAAMIEQGMVPLMNAHSQAIWQTQTPHELQGRVFAVRRVIAQFTWPLSTALAGILGGFFNPGAVVGVAGVLFGLFCVGQLFNPWLLRVEDKDWLDSLAAARAGSTAGH